MVELASDDIGAVLAEICEAAAAIVLPLWKTALTVERKSDESPVTIADRQAETFIVRRLEALFPGVDVPCELGVLEVELREKPGMRLPPALLEGQIRQRLAARQAALAARSRGAPPEVREKIAQLSRPRTVSGADHHSEVDC